MCIPSFQVPRVLLKSAIVTAPNEPSDTQEELQLASEGDLFAEVEKMICAMAVDGSTDLKGGTLKKAHFIGNKWWLDMIRLKFTHVLVVIYIAFLARERNTYCWLYIPI